ncbi:keratin-associated protein 16-1-like [Harpegnathos saltator]|uniref:keratin-associated protein 16-1-like n=1 Tax=Harpegnathos saltator TaxID=610380 RepID=UPI000DBEDB71|nr:keratin-associated protein 16-1-like [Harpegnathos saltator]
MTPADKSSSAERIVTKREAGGGCPPPICTYPSNRCDDSPDVDHTSSIGSSCRPSRCSDDHSPPQRSSCCQPYADSPLRPILKKKHGCCCGPRCNESPGPSCMCQPMPRGCNCPPPVRVDARAAKECTCDCPSSPECACPPSERRFPRTTRTCPNARLCRPFQRPSAGPKCPRDCTRYQSCLPPPCDPPCAFSECRPPAATKVTRNDPCRACSPCPSCPPCRAASPASTRSSACRPPTACGKLTTCDERQGPSPCPRTVPSPMALIISFALLIVVAVAWSAGLLFHRRHLSPKRICWGRLGL